MPEEKPTPTPEGAPPSRSTADEEMIAALQAGEQKAEPSEEAFYDASKVRPELRPSFVEMQKAYTQKTQELARLRKEIEAGRGTPDDVRHAEILRGLLQDQRVVRFLQKLRAEEAMPSGYREGGAEEESEDDPAVSAMVEKRVSPLRTEITNLRAQVSAAQEWDRFTRAHPDYMEYREGMAAALKENPNRSYVDAYNAAFREKAQRLLDDARKRAEARRNAPEGAGAGVPGRKNPKEPSSFEEALEASLEELSLTRKDIRGL